MVDRLFYELSGSIEYENHHVLDFDSNNKNHLHKTKAKPREKITRFPNNAKARDEHREAKSKTAQLTLIILIPPLVSTYQCKR